MNMNEWILISKDGKEVNKEDEIFTNAGEKCILKGGFPPLHDASTGRIYININDTQRELFPNVCGLKWVKHPEIRKDL